jgi:hypothetical protein
MPANDPTRPDASRRFLRSGCGLGLLTLWCFAATLIASAPQATPAASARTWLGRESQIEEHLKTAAVTRLDDIGTGVTRPRRAHLKPADPVESLLWKVLPPGIRGGYRESYKSEIAAYELDKLLQMHMVPPAVERSINGEVGAAVMWLEAVRSVKERGGQVPSGEIWGKPIRRMLVFDNLIGNHDRNAGNILVGPPGELILIDHSRAFVPDLKLPKKIERVDAEQWGRIMNLTEDDLTRTLRPWLDNRAVGAIVERRKRMAEAVDKLVATKGRALVILQ